MDTLFEVGESKELAVGSDVSAYCSAQNQSADHGPGGSPTGGSQCGSGNTAYYGSTGGTDSGAEHTTDSFADVVSEKTGLKIDLIGALLYSFLSGGLKIAFVLYAIAG